MNKTFKTYTRPSFLICTLVLAVSALGMSAAMSRLHIILIKKPIPLKNSFELMNDKALSPYTVIAKTIITNKDIIEALGTEDYLQWALRNTDAEPASLVELCSLFITYYTGDPDQVPHTPEECHSGAGNKLLGTYDVMMNVMDGETKKQIPARCLVFSKMVNFSQVEYPVIYFFRVNDTYKGNRTKARLQLASNFTGKYSYFSKVEITFSNKSNMTRRFPTKEEAITATEELLEVLLPVLEEDHWPRWE